jgi:hypothetical protein
MAQWDAAMRVLVAALAFVSVGTGLALYALERAAAHPLPASGPADTPPDGLAESVAALEQFARQLGPAAAAAGAVLRGMDRHAVSTARRHPYLVAAALALTYGALLSASQTIGEHMHQVSTPLLFLVVEASSMFAFLATIGSYLRLVRPTHPARGMARRAVDAAVLACASIPLAGGFRGELHWLIAPLSLGAHRLLESLLVLAVAVFAATFAGESLMGVHSPV